MNAIHFKIKKANFNLSSINYTSLIPTYLCHIHKWYNNNKTNASCANLLRLTGSINNKL